MKLKNKNTGEIVEITMPITNGDGWNIKASSLAELCEDWEDYKEEPYVIDMWEDDYMANVKFGAELSGIERAKECGLYFETKEEAEKAVEKLKAWKRLKDKGLKFKGISGYDEIHFWFPNPDDMFENSDTRKDLDLLFRDDKSSKEQTFHRADIEFGGEE